MTPYLSDASGYTGHADRVFTPASESEVVAIVNQARSSRTPVTISGGGTGLTGGRVPHGGWIVSLEKLLTLDVSAGQARVGAGVLLKHLHAAAARTGQFYAPDPTETWASLGGTIATNASGSRSFLYGPTRAHVLALRVVLMDGRVLHLPRGATPEFHLPQMPVPGTSKHTAGYYLRPGMDFLDLFIGSEGTLGIVTEATVRLLPAPESLLTAVVFFARDADALDAVESWRGIQGLRMLEYLDGASLALLKTPGAAALLIEQEMSQDPSGDAVDQWLDRLEHARADLEASWFGTGPEDRERFRAFRHALPERVNDTVRRHGCLKMGTDFAVPVARNREMLAIYRATLEREFPGQYVIFGHIGDAHLHANILPRGEEESARARDVMLALAKQAVALGGTVSAEHGLGKRKAHLLTLEYTPGQIEEMKTVKRRLDPEWLLGQGTLFPAEVA